MMERLPQHDIAAEESLLGSILIDSQAYFKVSYLRPEDFYRDKNMWVFQVFVDLAKNGIERDQTTVAHGLANKGWLEPCGGVAYLSGLIEHTPTSVNAVYYADIVKRCADYRRLGSVAGRIDTIAYDGGLDFDKSLSDALKLVTSLKKTTRSKLRTSADRANSAMETYENYANGKLKRIKFGLSRLDKIGGMGNGEYIILCGDTGMGKSTLKKQICEEVARLGYVLDCTGEMTESQVNQRELARILHIPMNLLTNESYIKDHLSEIIAATGELAESKILTLCGNVSPEDIYAEAVNIEGLKLITVDYLQLIKGVTSDYHATSLASSKLSIMAKELDIPVIVLSQLARDNAKKPEDRKHWMQRLKDSGNIENDADWVLNISRNQDAKPGTPEFRLATLSIGKHRQGGERFAIPLEFDIEGQKYLEVQNGR